MTPPRSEPEAIVAAPFWSILAQSQERGTPLDQFAGSNQSPVPPIQMVVTSGTAPVARLTTASTDSGRNGSGAVDEPRDEARP